MSFPLSACRQAESGNDTKVCYNIIMGIFTLPSKSPLGIDISDLSLKLVQLKKTRRGIFMQALSRIEVPENYIDSGIIKNRKGVLALLQKMLKETIFGKITSREAVASLPEVKTFAKLIAVDYSGKNLGRAVEHEMEKHIPFDPHDINYDWQLIKKEGGIKKILINVAPKNIADDYAGLLIAAGLIPVALEIEAVSICRSILPPAHCAKGTTFIVDVGATRSSLIAYAGGSILFTISLPVSGKKYTKIIAEKLGLSPEKAEAAKIICGLNQKAAEGIIAKILEEMTSELVKKIKTGISYLNTHYPEFGHVSQIYLCGGGANLEGLDAILTKKITIDTSIGNIFTNIEMSQRQENKYFQEELATLKKIAANNRHTQNFSPTFAVAVGLALRNIYTDEI